MIPWIFLAITATVASGQQLTEMLNDAARARERRLNMRPKPRPPINPNSTTYFIERLLAKYDKQEPPMKDRPTEVKIGIYINSFYSISEQTMDYSVSMYVRQQWCDRRLSFKPTNGGRRGTSQQVRLGDDNWNRIWLPDTFFRNEKRATFHEVTVDNRLLRLNASGCLWYVIKVSATLSCPMRLQKYPFDTQVCPMMFESFGHTMDVMYFDWLPGPVEIDPGIQLPQFKLISSILHDCSQNYTGGAFPCLDIRFVLRRDIGYFIIQIYIPSMLIVILSWVSFWLNVEASPARVSIGLLTVLTTTTQSTGINAALPKVSYIKAIDVWMSVSLVFVFAALLEYAVVNVLARRQAVHVFVQSMPRAPQFRLSAVAIKQTESLSPISSDSQGIDQSLTERWHQDRPHRYNGGAVDTPPAGTEFRVTARRVDRLSRQLFPLSFLVFNVIYWVFYTVSFSEKTEADDV